MRLAILLLILSLPAQAQNIGGTTVFGGTVAIGGGANSWPTNPKNIFFRDSSGGGTGGGSCPATVTTTCVVNVSSISAKDTLACFYFNGSTGASLSSCSGETWSACPNSCNSSISGPGIVDMKYVARAVGGESTITCTGSTGGNGYQGCGVIDFGIWSGLTVAADISGASTNSSCTTCAGPSVTLSGSNDVCAVTGLPANLLTAVSSPYSANSHFYSGSGESGANGITSSPQQATWTQNSAGAISMNALCLKGS